MIVDIINADKETVRKILHAESLCEVGPTKFVLQKRVDQQICSDFLKRLDEEPELKENVITCNETWIFQ